MIISDLSYLENASEVNTISGGWKKSSSYFVFQKNDNYTSQVAVAIGGFKAYASNYNSTYQVNYN